MYANESEPIVTPPDIQKALDDWRTINLNPFRWATFETEQFENQRITHVRWGHIHFDGFKEIAIQTINYTLLLDGTVYVSKYTHV